MTKYYNHASLYGEALHCAKVVEIPHTDTLPSPQWEGQLIAQGDTFYYAIKLTGGSLGWRSVKSPLQTLPSNTVTYQTTTSAPPSATGSGKIHVNSSTGEVFFLVNNGWVKIGPKPAGFYSEGTNIGNNYCSAGQNNAIKISRATVVSGKNYAFALTGRLATSIVGSDNSNFFAIYTVNADGSKSNATPLATNITSLPFLLIATPSAWPSDYIQVMAEKWITPPGIQILAFPSCFEYDNNSRIFKIT